mmetsp:Transcript_51489/g.148604  ORF Transcript_51489/g.148604 Transcript_51489/m.148604 type:complete len:80 (-) Transcript_51489:1676-1915(-)
MFEFLNPFLICFPSVATNRSNVVALFFQISFVGFRFRFFFQNRNNQVFQRFQGWISWERRQRHDFLFLPQPLIVKEQTI